jgi:hypothetical protein
VKSSAVKCFRIEQNVLLEQKYFEQKRFVSTKVFRIKYFLEQKYFERNVLLEQSVSIICFRTNLFHN